MQGFISAQTLFEVEDLEATWQAINGHVCVAMVQGHNVVAQLRNI
jgi:hypothetical protein